MFSWKLCVFIRNGLQWYVSFYFCLISRKNWLKRGTYLIRQTKHRWNTLCTRMHKSNIFIWKTKNKKKRNLLNFNCWFFNFADVCAWCCFSFAFVFCLIFFFFASLLPHSNVGEFVSYTYLWWLCCVVFVIVSRVLFLIIALTLSFYFG